MTNAFKHTVRGTSAFPGGQRTALELVSGDDRVPAILLRPTAPDPVPAALLLHGYSSRKEHMADTLGRALLERNVASLAVDLPLHGERSAPVEAMSVGNPLELMRRWNAALAECAKAFRYLEGRGDVDGARLALVGYSLGSYLGVIAAAREPAVRAVVLAAGGDLPAGTPFAALVRGVADPLRAVRKLAGRPLLMVNGKGDRTIRPDQAERLFAAAGEPKEIRWWDTGHYLPPAAIGDAAEWLAARLGARGAMRRAEGGGRG